MPFYNICPECGNALDPGETCECQADEADYGKPQLVCPEETFALSY